jgi:cysteine synthase B
MVYGLKNFDEGVVPPVFVDGNGYDLLNRKKAIGIRESLTYTRKLRDVGVFAGISSGAVAAGAAKCAAEIEAGTIVIVIADGGWKYLSTGAWTDDLDVVEERAKGIIYF